jgi:hypothetical protein
MIRHGAILFCLAALWVVPIWSHASAQTKEIAGLAQNQSAWIGWVPAKMVAAVATKQYDDSEARAILGPFIEMVETEFGGTLREFQFRFHIGTVPFVLRGTDTGARIVAYLFRDGEYDFEQWAWLPSIVRGPFLVLDQEATDKMSDLHQRHFEAHFGPDVMLEDMQLEFQQTKGAARKRIVILGVMRWKAPRTHLHSVIVCWCN